MTTGAYVRIQRDGRWVNVDFVELTNEEMEAFFLEHPEDGAKWACFLAKWIRDNPHQEAYDKGLRDGIQMFAWWKDGVQYVGSCGTTLKDALAECGLKGE